MHLQVCNYLRYGARRHRYSRRNCSLLLPDRACSGSSSQALVNFLVMEFRKSYYILSFVIPMQL
jgi:hypothetical protein